MKLSRRELTALLPLLAAAPAAASPEAKPLLQSKVYPFDKLPAKKSENGNIGRAVLDGRTHENFPMEVHITDLPPGGAPHPAHRHGHEEMILVREGTMEVTIEGKKTIAGPGSVTYVASNELHGWKNAGDTRAQYFVVAFGHDTAAA